MHHKSGIGLPDMLLDPSSRLRTLLIEHQQSVIEDCGALLYARAVTLVGRQTARQLVEQIVSAVHNHLLALLEREVDICDLAYQLNTDDFSTTLAQWSGPQGLGLVPGKRLDILSLLKILRTAYGELLWATDDLGSQIVHCQRFLLSYFDQLELSLHAYYSHYQSPTLPTASSTWECPLAKAPHGQPQGCSQAAVANLPGAVYRCRVDPDWTMEVMTNGIKGLTGYTASDFVHSSRRTFNSIIHPNDQARVWQTVTNSLAKQTSFSVEYRIIAADRTTRWLSDYGQGLWDETGKLVFLDGILLDITEHRQAKERLTLLSAACDQSPTSIVITNHCGDIQYVNPRFETITGYTAAEVQGKNPRILKTGHTSAEQYRQLWQTITQGNIWYGEFLNRKKNGEYFWETASIAPVKDINGQITHFVAVKEDITRHKETIEMLAYQTQYDLLTELPNRALALDHLQLALSQAQRDSEYVALLLVDLDSFKGVNETLGHDMGDRLLCQVAQRLKSLIQQGNTVARLGGDEFLVLLQGQRDLSNIGRVANQMLIEIERPYLIDGIECYSSASIGISTYPLDGESPGILLRNADIALYKAKNTGRNSIKFFEVGMNLDAQRRHQIANQLRRALEFDEFHLVYQPSLNLHDNCIVGAEALLRWENERLGSVSPGEFIPVAEETGLIIPIGNWVIREVCHQARQWHQLWGNHLRLAVNLSPQQFRSAELVDVIRQTLQDNQLSADHLELEITERLLLDDSAVSQGLMNQLQQMDLRLAIDDFGTGYSALSYLRKFSLDILKIDRSFVTDLPHDENLNALVKAIIGMAHELGLEVIAEGIETREQLSFLKAQGCDYGQGHLFSRALRPDDFLAYVKQGYVCDVFR
jgi:diguanylate cyclase (GGDEF)-like protein/PAS domain S-box-containing protein